MSEVITTYEKYRGKGRWTEIKVVREGDEFRLEGEHNVLIDELSLSDLTRYLRKQQSWSIDEKERFLNDTAAAMAGDVHAA